MKTPPITLFTILLVFTLSVSGRADSDRGNTAGTSREWRVQAGPIVSYNLGKTKYTFEQLVLVPLAGGGTIPANVKSQLDFPMDVVMAGGILELERRRRGHTDLTLTARLLSNVADPHGSMLDRDWVDDLEFSHTDSDARMWTILFDLELRKRLTGKTESGLFLYAGYRMQRISQDLINLWGWQLAGTVLPTQTNITLSGPVAGYEVSYNVPQLGLFIRLAGRRSSLGIRAAYGLAFVSDQDHHLLRNFTAESRGIGNALLARLGLSQVLPRLGHISGIHLSLTGDFTYITASPSETLTFYGDDPGTTADETGTVLQKIPHKVQTTQGNLALRVGMSF